jgi:hypothetical protein
MSDDKNGWDAIKDAARAGVFDKDTNAPSDKVPCLTLCSDGAYRFNNGRAPSAESIVGEFHDLFKRREISFEKLDEFLRASLARHGDARYADGKREALANVARVVAEQFDDFAVANNSSGDWAAAVANLRAAAREDGIALD